MPASLSDALSGDDSLPLDLEAKEYWLKDLQNPLRVVILPTLKILLSITLHITYYLKRLSPIQWRAHGFLQWQICFFMKHFVRHISAAINRSASRNIFLKTTKTLNIIRHIQQNSSSSPSFDSISSSSSHSPDDFLQEFDLQITNQDVIQT